MRSDLKIFVALLSVAVTSSVWSAPRAEASVTNYAFCLSYKTEYGFGIGDAQVSNVAATSVLMTGLIYNDGSSRSGPLNMQFSAKLISENIDVKERSTSCRIYSTAAAAERARQKEVDDFHNVHDRYHHYKLAFIDVGAAWKHTAAPAVATAKKPTAPPISHADPAIILRVDPNAETPAQRAAREAKGRQEALLGEQRAQAKAQADAKRRAAELAQAAALKRKFALEAARKPLPTCGAKAGMRPCSARSE